VKTDENGIALSRKSSNTTRDEPMLRSILSDLDQVDFDLNLIGFDNQEIDDLLFRTEDRNEAADGFYHRGRRARRA
jgi:hypothetical protein